MNVLTKPISIITLLAWVLAFVLGYPAVASVLLIAWIGVLALQSMRNSSRRYSDETLDNLDPESRTLFSPIRKLVANIEQAVEKSPDSAAVSVIGPEAIEEAQRIKAQCASALDIRSELKRAGRGEGLARHYLQELQGKVSEAESNAEKEALESAVEAKTLELQHYSTIEGAIRRIDAGLKQAEAALSEMHARLLVSASDEAAVADQNDELREAIGRMKALSLSYEEAEQMIRGS